jgi:preprotein translocase subunit SecG
MTAVLLVIHVLVCIALVTVILMQRSEGGALGIGDGGGFMSARGAGNALTKATAILAAIFFINSVLLTVLQSEGGGGPSLIDRIQQREQTAPAPITTPVPAPTPSQPATPTVPLNN